MTNIVMTTSQFIGGLVAIFGFMLGGLRWATWNLHARVTVLETQNKDHDNKNEAQDERICKLGEQNELLIQGMVGLLQGQIDQGRDGEVKKAYDNLQNYLIQQANK